MRIFLVGYMGSGKTTVGKWLASRMSLPFIDLDEQIEKAQGRSIQQIFDEDGESVFRQMEHSELTRQIEMYKNFIMATGGGTFCSEANIDLMHSAGLSIYLKVSTKEIERRISSQTTWRPLLKKIPPNDLLHFITQHLKGREHWYNRCSIICPNEKENFESIATSILNHRSHEN